MRKSGQEVGLAVGQFRGLGSGKVPWPQKEGEGKKAAARSALWFCQSSTAIEL